MSLDTPLGTAPTDSPVPARPTAFIVGTFVLAAVVGVVVLALGLSGAFPGVIPGSHAGNGVTAPPVCQGNDGLGNYTFAFVAGAAGGFWFNGTHPGPCVTVQVGSRITVDLSVAADAGQNHSWVLVNASNASTAVSTPVFAGAGMTGAARFMGIAPGTSMVFHFNASSVGVYQYICEMTGHYAFGMFGWFNVTAHPMPPATIAPHAASDRGVAAAAGRVV